MHEVNKMNHDTANTMIVKTYENEGLLLNVQFTGEAFFNATAVAKAFWKRPADWLALDSTKEYIEAITRKYVLEQNQVVMVRSGSPDNGGGTWMHPKLAIAFARWLNVDFSIWCDEQIEAILKPVPQPLSAAELILQQAQMLVAYEKRMEEFNDRVKRIECKQQAFEDGIRYFTVELKMHNVNSECFNMNLESLKAKYRHCSDTEFRQQSTPEECWFLLSQLLNYPISISGLYRSCGGYIIENADDLKDMLLALLDNSFDDDDLDWAN
jgi:hypothetical protein